MRPCESCLKYCWDEDKKRLIKNPRTGEPIPRPPGNVAPCRLPAGCPKGTAENQRSLTPQNMLAYRHFLECRAVGQFPDDPLVRRNAGLIAEAIDDVRRLEMGDLAAGIQAMSSITRQMTGV